MQTTVFIIMLSLVILSFSIGGTLGMTLALSGY